MSKDRIRIGIMGVGWIALGAHYGHLKKDKRTDLVAICRRNNQLLASAAAMTNVSNTYTDWRKMLNNENLDAIIVCTPNNLHAEPTITALSKGLHVLVEKPMALTSKDANAMIEAARASEGQLMVAYNRRCDPLYRAAHEAIREGQIGKLRQISTISFFNLLGIYDPILMPKSVTTMVENADQMKPFIQDALKDGNWRSDRTAAGGGWFVDLMTHYVDLMLWFAGSPAHEVSCLLATNGLPVERALTTQAILENGMLFSLSFTDGVDADQEKYFGLTETVLTGDSGVLMVKDGPLSQNGTQIELISGGERRQITSEGDTGGTTGMFIDLISNGGDNPAPPEECAWTVALTEASYQSAKAREIISLGS